MKRFNRLVAWVLTFTLILSIATPTFANELALNEIDTISTPSSENELLSNEDDKISVSDSVYKILPNEDDTIQMIEEMFEQQSPNGTFAFKESEILLTEGDEVATEFKVLRTGGTEGEASLDITVTDVNAIYGEDYSLFYNEEEIPRIKDAFSLYDIMDQEKAKDLPIEQFIVVEEAPTYEPNSLMGLKQAVNSVREISPEAKLEVKSAQVTLNFKGGQDSATLKIVLHNDSIGEFDEHFSLTLSEPKMGVLGLNKVLNVTLQDDEVPPETYISFVNENSEKTNDIQLVRTGDISSISRVTVYETVYETVSGAVYESASAIGDILFAPYQKIQTFDTNGGQITLDNFIGASAGDITSMFSGVAKGNQPIKTCSANYTQLMENSTDEDWETYSLDKMEPTEYRFYAWWQRQSGAWYTDTYGGGRHKPGSTIVSSEEIDWRLYDKVKITSTGRVGSNANYMRLTLTNERDSSTDDSNVLDNQIWVSGRKENQLYEDWLDVPSNQGTARIKIGTRRSDKKQSGASFIINSIKLHKRAFDFQILDSNSLEYLNSTTQSFAPSVRYYGNKTAKSNNREINLSVKGNAYYGAKVIGFQICLPNEANGNYDVKATGKTNKEFLEFDDNFLRTYYSYAEIKSGSSPKFYIKPIVEHIPVIVDVEQLYDGGNIIIKPEQATYNKGDKISFETTKQEGMNLFGIKHTEKASELSDTNINSNIMLQSPYNKQLIHSYNQFYGLFSSYENSVKVMIAAGSQGDGNTIEGTTVSPNNTIPGRIAVQYAKANSGYVTKWILPVSLDGEHEIYGDYYYHKIGNVFYENDLKVDFVSSKNITNDAISGRITRSDVNLFTGITKQLPLANAIITLEGRTATTNENGEYTLSRSEDSALQEVQRPLAIGKKYSVLISYNNMEHVTTLTIGKKNTYNLKVPQFGDGMPTFGKNTGDERSITVKTGDTDISSNVIELKNDIDNTIVANVISTSGYRVSKVNFTFRREDGSIASTTAVNYNAEHPDAFEMKFNTNTVASTYSVYCALVVNELDTDGNLQGDSIELEAVNTGIVFIPPATPELIDVTLPDLEVPTDAQIELPLIGKFNPQFNFSNGALMVKGAYDPKTNTYVVSIDPTIEGSKSEITTGFTVGELVKPDVSFKLTYALAGQKPYLNRVELSGSLSGAYTKTKHIQTPIGIPVYVSFNFNYSIAMYIEVKAANKEDGVVLSEIFTNKSYPRQYRLGADHADVSLKAGAGFNGLLNVGVSGSLTSRFVWDIINEKYGGQVRFSAEITAQALIFKATYKFADYTTKFGDEETGELPLTLKSAGLTNGYTDFEVEKRIYSPLQNAPTMRGEQVVEGSKAYYASEPILISLNGGKILLLGLMETGDGTECNSIKAGYSVFDGSIWSPLTQIDTNSDGKDSLDYGIYAYDIGDKIAVAWTSSKSEIDEDNSLSENLESTDIFTAFFDKNDPTPEQISIVGGDEFAKSMPVILKDDIDDIVYCYFKSSQHDVSDNSLDDNLGVFEYDETYAYKTWDNDNGEWTGDYSLLGDNLYRSMADKLDGERFVNLESTSTGKVIELIPFNKYRDMTTITAIFGEMIVVDADGDIYNTPEDRSVWVRIINPDSKAVIGTFQISSKDVPAQNIRVVYKEAGKPILIWKENGKLVGRENFVDTAEGYADTTRQDILSKTGAVDEIIAFVNGVNGDQKSCDINADTGFPSILYNTVIPYDYDVEINDNGDLCIAWVDEIPLEERKDNTPIGSTEIYGAIISTVERENSYVGVPVKLTDYGQYVGTPSVIYNNGNYYISYTRYIKDDNNEKLGQALSAIEYDDTINHLKLNDIVISDDTPIKGQEIEIKVPVYSSGLGYSNDFTVKVYADENLIGSELGYIDILPSGLTNTFVVNYTVPDNFNGQTIKAEVLTDGVVEDTIETTLKYESEFETSIEFVENLAQSHDFKAKFTVINNGNKPDSAKVILSAKDRVFAEDDPYGVNINLWEAATKILEVGESEEFIAEFTPKELDNVGGLDVYVYTEGEGEKMPASYYTANVAITPEIETTPTTNEVSKGTMLSDISINGGKIIGEDGELSGSLAWEDGNVEIVSNGRYNAIFTPEDTNYLIITVPVNVSIKKSGGSSRETTDKNTSENGTTKVELKRTDSTDWENPFNDISENDWFYNAVQYANKNGLMNGTDSTKFEPNTALTRGMFVTVLYRIEKEPNAGLSKFSDVNADEYYSKAIAWASENGIVKGINEIEFVPNDEITREQMATIIYRYAKYLGKIPEGAWAIKLDYTDLASISDYAMEAVMFCKLKDIMTGNNNIEFMPKNNASRAETAAVLQKIIENILK